MTNRDSHNENKNFVSRLLSSAVDVSVVPKTPIYVGGIADSSGFHFATGTPLNLDASGSSRDFFDPYIRIPVTIGDVTLMKVLSRDTIVFCEYCGTGDTFGDGYCLRCGAPYSEKLFEGYRK